MKKNDAEESLIEKTKTILEGIDSSNKLEVALEFLHNCIGQKPANMDKLNPHFESSQIDSLKESFLHYKIDSPESLIEFRDKLLELIKS